MSDELIPGPDPGACPDCGAWRKAGMLHSCVTDEIPQEVRAAVRRILGGYSERQDERWRGLVTWEQHDAKAVQILAAVLPLIEQRVIDRLAREDHEKAHCPTCGTPNAVDVTDGWTQRLDDLYAEWCRGHEAGLREGAEEERDRLAGEAGEPPYEEWNPTRAVWLEAVACGVAAERARCPLCDHEWRRHDPEDGMCDCHDETAIGPCRCGRDLAWVQERIAAMSSAALAPERTGEGA